MKKSRTKTKIAALVLSTALLAGCAGPIRNQDIGMVTGTALGGLTGHALFGGTGGTIGGAVVGGVLGNQIGRQYDYYEY